MKELFPRTKIDWILIGALLPILGAGLVTMNSLGEGTDYFSRQLMWIGISLIIFFIISMVDVRFLRKSNTVISLYLIGIGMLLALFIAGSTVKGATSWLDLGGFSLQPADFMKLILVIVLAKYFSRRHQEIKHPKHIFISAAYMVIPFILIFLQPDTGSAAIILAIWFGMILVSGISKRHLLIMTLAGVMIVGAAWSFVLQPYQRDRVLTFLNPLEDIQGSGYNAYQSMVAVGSGQLFGKGVGYGTQSRLQFLPEYQTDFIFAAFAEEWGFMGVILLFILYGIVIWRILLSALRGSSNFETFFGIGIAIMIMAHFIINIGTNINLLPVTGITLPFMSHGGSHLLTTFIALGLLQSMRSYGRTMRRAELQSQTIDFLGE
jgi:rod shape determining protein RodA